MATKTLITSIEGPKGKADLFELAEEGSPSIAVEYGVEFKGNLTKFMTLGEAYIEAGQAAGTPT